MMIKFVILGVMAVVCVISVSSVTPQQLAIIQSKLLSGGLTCIQDYPLTLAEIRSLQKQMLPDGENAKCFAACLFKNIGIMDNMGNLNTTSARRVAQEVFRNGDKHLEKTEQIIEDCSSVNDAPTSDGAKGCDRAELAFNCFSKSSAKNGFHIDI